MTTPPPQDPYGTPRPEQSGQSAQWPQYGQQFGQQYGQPPVGYGPPAWGQGGPGGPGGQSRTEPKAIIALVCAIGAWLVFPLLPAIAALMVGSSARRDIEASGGWLTGEGLVTAARIVAWANIVLCVLGVLLAVLAFGVFAASMPPGLQ